MFFLETERKIITSPAVFDKTDYFITRRVLIEQTYASTKKFCEIRLRTGFDNDGVSEKEFTIKLPINKFRRVELKIPVPKAIFNKLFSFFRRKGSIQKIRSYYEDLTGKEISLDFYVNPVNLYLAEIESPSAYRLPEVPPFLQVGGVEVTGDESYTARMIFRNFFLS